MSDFLLFVKSTIDRYGTDLATALAIPNKVDLDDLVNTREMLASDGTAVVWELTTLTDDPIDPLYDLLFSMGIKTNDDPSNYNMMDLLSDVKDIFPVGDTLFVRDYSGDVEPTENKGTMTISDVRVDPQQFDRVAGIRMVTVHAKAVRDA